jgi:hypothetical protein
LPITSYESFTNLLLLFFLFLSFSLQEITAKRNADGDLVGTYQGEEVIFPELETTLDFVLSTPVDVHLFEESPIVKMHEVSGTNNYRESK